MAIDRQNIKNKFRSEENLPEELSWKNMKEGILNKMEEQKPLPAYSFSDYKYYMLALCFIILGGAYIFVNHETKRLANKNIANNILSTRHSAKHENVENKTALSPTQKISNSSSASSVNVENINIVHKKPSNSKNTFITMPKDEANIIDQLKLIKPFEKVETADNKKVKLVENYEPKFDPSNQDLFQNKNGEDNLSSQKNEAINKVPIMVQESTSTKSYTIPNSKNDLKSDTTDVTKNLALKEANEQDHEYYQILAALPIKYVAAQSLEKKQAIIKQDILLNPIPIKNIIESKYLVYLLGGVIKGQTKFANDAIGNLKSSYEKDVIGYTFGIGIERKLNNNFTLELGANYQEINMILDYTNTTKYNERRSNVLLGIEINPVINDTVKVYGDGYVSGIMTRRVLHYNVEKTICIPLALRKNWQLNAITIGLGLGPTFNYNISNAGRTIIAVDSFNTITNDYTSKLYLGLNGLLNIGYNLSEHLTFGMKSSINIPFDSIDKNANATIRRNLLSGGLYLGCRF